jgi:hypothetical protein
MRCDDFRANYQAIVSGTALAGDSMPEAMNEDWADHLHACNGCSDWYQEQQVRDRGEDPARFPCVHIAYQVTQRCQEHEDPWDCPDHVLVYDPRYDEYGIPIRDGGSSQVGILHCPWCGIELPPSKRALWFETLASLGYADPWQQDLPEEFASDQWWRRLQSTPGG